MFFNLINLTIMDWMWYLISFWLPSMCQRSLGSQLGSFVYLNHRTKSHGSAFFKRDGNIELHVSATFTFSRNVLYQVLAILSSFRNVSGREMSSHVWVIFRTFPLLFVSVMFLQTDVLYPCWIFAKRTNQSWFSL